MAVATPVSFCSLVGNLQREHSQEWCRRGHIDSKTTVAFSVTPATYFLLVMPPVHVDASRTNRSLAAAAAGPSRRPQLEANPVLLVYRRLIDTAVTEAKKTRHGAPTDNALMQRYWIQQHRPLRTDKDEWERSFECACHFLELDVDAERKRLLAEIDDAITEAVVRHVSNVSYLRMAAVLTCAGVPTVHTRLLPSGRTAKQYALGLVSVEDYDDVAGV